MVARAAVRAVSPLAGPPALGRGVVVTTDGAVPEPWIDAETALIDEQTLVDPALPVGRLHQLWASRQPVVIRLAIDPQRFRDAVDLPGEPWTERADLELWLDRLHFLVWANNYDARQSGPPIWWWARRAARVFGVGEHPDADIEVAGRPAWVDGGPRPAPQLGGEGQDLASDRLIVHRESVEVGRLPDPESLNLSEPTPLVELAPDQLAAVNAPAGPARIIAPAGSGKTRVLTERLRHLHLTLGFERETTLALAYNKKAQEEMVERTSAFSPRVRTLNSLGLDLIRRHRGAMPRMLDERDVRRMIEDIVPMKRRRSNTDPLGPYLEALSSVRLALRDPADVEAERDDVPGLAEVFPVFRQRLTEAGAIDFDEQIYGAIEALLSDGAFRRTCQESTRHLLVDEFQDLTPAHLLLIRLLATPTLDVFGVGDDDQVIYGHAGATPKYLIDFDRLFPNGSAHPLEVNYRSSSEIVAGARRLLGYNRQRVDKTIREAPGAAVGPALTVMRHAPEEGAADLVDVVGGWLDSGTPAAEIAVLARVNSFLLPPTAALLEADIPVASTLDARVFERTGMRAALAYLRIGAWPDQIDGQDVIEILRRPTRGLPQWFPDRLRGQEWTTARIRAIAERVEDKVAKNVHRLVDDLETVVAATEGSTTREALTSIRDDIGLESAMDLLDGNRQPTGSTHVDDLEALLAVADLEPNPQQFEIWLRRLLETPAVTDGVILSTVHRVKGQEWDRVITYGASSGILPHRLADNIEEERRVLHVALTRARLESVILADRDRPSPFLAELDGTAPTTSTPTDRTPRSEPAGRPAKTKATSPTPAEPAEADVPIVEALRAWRRQRSKADGVPPYVVFNDATMLVIAATRPTTPRQLLAVPGIGPRKLEDYGEEILALVADTP